jgi:hypothetical protein
MSSPHSFKRLVIAMSSDDGELHKDDQSKYELAVKKTEEIKQAFESIFAENSRPYNTLELEYGASPDEIMQSYLKLKRIYNLDYFPDNPDLTEKIRRKQVEIKQALDDLIANTEDAENETLPTDSLKLSLNNKTTNKTPITNTSQSETKPKQSETKPNESETKPNESETKPNESETKPNESETKPNESETKPNESETKPNEILVGVGGWLTWLVINIVIINPIILIISLSSYQENISDMSIFKLLDGLLYAAITLYPNPQKYWADKV